MSSLRNQFINVPPTKQQLKHATVQVLNDYDEAVSNSADDDADDGGVEDAATKTITNDQSLNFNFCVICFALLMFGC